MARQLGVSVETVHLAELVAAAEVVNADVVLRPAVLRHRPPCEISHTKQRGTVQGGSTARLGRAWSASMEAIRFCTRVAKVRAHGPRRGPCCYSALPFTVIHRILYTKRSGVRRHGSTALVQANQAAKPCSSTKSGASATACSVRSHCRFRNSASTVRPLTPDSRRHSMPLSICFTRLRKTFGASVYPLYTISYDIRCLCL